MRARSRKSGWGVDGGHAIDILKIYECKADSDTSKGHFCSEKTGMLWGDFAATLGAVALTRYAIFGRSTNQDADAPRTSSGTLSNGRETLSSTDQTERHIYQTLIFHISFSNPLLGLLSSSFSQQHVKRKTTRGTGLRGRLLLQ